MGRAPFGTRAFRSFRKKNIFATGRELSNAADKVPDGWWANCRAIVLECGNLPPFAIGRNAPMIEQELLFICPPRKLAGLLLI